MRGVVVAEGVAVQNAVLVGLVPRVALRGVGSRVQDAVHALAVRGAEVGRSAFARQSRHGQHDLVALQRLAPLGKQRLSLSEQVERALLDLGLGGHDSITGPVEPEAATVVVDGLLITDQRARRNGRVRKGLDQRHVDLVAAILARLQQSADDGGGVVAHVGREHVAANVLADDVVAENNPAVVSLNGGDSHCLVLKT